MSETNARSKRKAKAAGSKPAVPNLAEELKSDEADGKGKLEKEYPALPDDSTPQDIDLNAVLDTKSGDQDSDGDKNKIEKSGEDESDKNIIIIPEKAGDGIVPEINKGVAKRIKIKRMLLVKIRIILGFLVVSKTKLKIKTILIIRVIVATKNH